MHDHLHLLNISPDFLTVGISGMDSSVIHSGRPYGGCAIFYRKSLHSSVVQYNSPSSRFCAISIRDDSNLITLLVCVYLPTNYGSDASNDEFLYTLGELEGFIESQQFDRLVVAGDFNVDFDRSSFCSRHLSLFMSDLSLQAADLPYRSSVGFTYARDGGSSFSWLDHFLCTTTCVSLITDVRRIDFGSNHSDHHPLSCSLAISVSSSPSPASRCSPVKSRTAWCRVNSLHLDAFCFQIMNRLPIIPSGLLSCCNPVCADHHSLLDICDKLLLIVQQSAQDCLPSCQSKRVIPGWNDAARMHAEK